MSAVNFRWLSEPVGLKETGPALADQARNHPKPRPSTHPSARRLIAFLRRISGHASDETLLIVHFLDSLPGRPVQSKIIPLRAG